MEPARAPEQEHAGGFGRWLAVLAVGVVVVALVGYRVLRNEPTDKAMTSAAPPSPVAKTESAPRADLAPAATEQRTAPKAQTAAAPAEAAAAVEPAASAASAPAPSASSVTAEQVASTGKRSVLLKSIPPKARFFHFGKEVGVAPFVLELEPGERHAYEAGLPGYVTRKVIVDGSQPEITVGLRSEKR